jgi:GNAT superfamily N-acetyltransferase
MITIRPFEPTDADYEAFAALVWAVWPEYRDTVEELRHRDETRDRELFFERFLVESEDSIVASGLCCEPWWSVQPGKYYVAIEVHPDHRRQGIGMALYNHLMRQLAEHEPAKLLSSTREDCADGVRFLTQRGFKQVMRYPISHLDVAGFDPKPFAKKVAQVEASGVNILPLAEIATVWSDWKQRLYELGWEIAQDVPSPDPLTKQPFDVFQTRVLGAPDFDPQAWFIALEGDQWVGMSNLWLPKGDPDKIYTGLTGVVRSHRRRGIATAAKLRGIDYAKQRGAKIIETDNEENNPMYFLNLALGFEPQPAMIDFEKQIEKD